MPTKIHILVLPFSFHFKFHNKGYICKLPTLFNDEKIESYFENCKVFYDTKTTITITLGCYFSTCLINSEIKSTFNIPEGKKHHTISTTLIEATSIISVYLQTFFAKLHCLIIVFLDS